MHSPCFSYMCLLVAENCHDSLNRCLGMGVAFVGLHDESLAASTFMGTCLYNSCISTTKSPKSSPHPAFTELLVSTM